MSVTFTDCEHEFSGLRVDAEANSIAFTPNGPKFNTDKKFETITISCDGLDLERGQYKGHYTPGTNYNISKKSIHWGGKCNFLSALQ